MLPTNFRLALAFLALLTMPLPRSVAEPLILKHEGPVLALAFSPDGKTLVTTIANEQRPGEHFLLLWDFPSGKQPQKLAQFQDQPRPKPKLDPLEEKENPSPAPPQPPQLQFGSDGALLATWDIGPHHRVSHVWQLAAGKETQVRVAQRFSDWQPVAASSDGRARASCRRIFGEGDDRPDLVKLWLGPDFPAPRHTWNLGDQSCLAFSPDSRMLATAATTDRLIRIWEVTTGKERFRFKGPAEPSQVLAFSPDGLNLLTAHKDGKVVVHSLPELVLHSSGQTEKPTPEELEKLWSGLGDSDGFVAFRALIRLRQCPKVVAAFAQKQWTGEPHIDPVHLQRRIEELDHPELVTRQAAEEELERAGTLAVPSLCQVLGSKPSLRLYKRAELLLRLLDEDLYLRCPPDVSLDQLRGARLLELLEHRGAPEDYALLQRMLLRSSDAWLSYEIRYASLRQVGQAPSPPRSRPVEDDE